LDDEIDKKKIKPSGSTLLFFQLDFSRWFWKQLKTIHELIYFQVSHLIHHFYYEFKEMLLRIFPSIKSVNYLFFAE